MEKEIREKPILGKFILDSISIGMYNHPLMLYREYIQNSADAIDEAIKAGIVRKGRDKIELVVDGSERRITIKDNGVGIAAARAESVLQDIGKSTKRISVHRGFRGIGRLGGIGYCDELHFITKAKGEKVCSTSTWDCFKLRELINDYGGALDAKAVIEKIVRFTQTSYEGNLDDHFFIVEMHNVKSIRDQLINVPLIKSYLSQVAPVPFDDSKFEYAHIIETNLRRKVPSYEVYDISLNGEKIFKPYSNDIGISKSVSDRIKSIRFIDFLNEDKTSGFCWIAELELLGCISASEGMEGLRVRTGNILVGDKSLLAKYFKESRFGNYLVGEIHTVDNGLILNSRRDDFEDNKAKEIFYSCCVREIGLPYSQMIREQSERRNKTSTENRTASIITTAQRINRIGHLSKIQKNNIIFELKRIAEKSGEADSVKHLIDQVKESSHFLNRNYTHVPIKIKSILERVFEVVYKNCSDKKEAEVIITNIVKHVDEIFVS